MSSATEEYEPLGQKINNWDPSGDDDPPSGTPEPIGSASDPEWQCQIPTYFYGGFSGMPWHCQWADIKRRAFEGEQLWKFESVEDPHKIGGAKKAEGGGSQAVNLTATDKPEMEADGGSPIDPSAVPSQDGEKKPPKLKKGRLLSPEELAIKRAIAATGIFDDEGTQESRIFDDTIPGMKDASYQGKQKIDNRLPSNLRDQVAKVDEDVNCRAFIKLIYDDLKSRGEDYRSTSLVRIFDSTKVLEINSRQAGHTNGGATSVRQGNAGYIYYATVLNQYLGKTVAELSHLGKAGKDDYSDSDLDKAAENVLGAGVTKIVKDFIKQQGKQDSAGNVGHFAINTACYTAVENALGANQ